MKLDSYLTQILLAVFMAVAALLGTQVKNLYKKYVNTEIKQSVCRTVVRFVEQIYKDIHGPEKLAKAMERASSILAGYGITISEEELTSLLEAAVNEFNKSFGGGDLAGKHSAGNVPTYGDPVADPDETPLEPITLGEIIADLKDTD